MQKKVVKEGKYKGHVVLHDEDSGVTHHMIPHHMLPHHMLKFYPKDLLQVMIGASVLAIPVGFTEETWRLGAELPLSSIIFLAFLSILFISEFIYYNYYKHRIKEHKLEFVTRIFITYFMSLFIVSVLLSVIGKANWSLEFLISLKRSIIVAFPASMSAAVADVLK